MQAMSVCSGQNYFKILFYFAVFEQFDSNPVQSSSALSGKKYA